MRLVIRLLSRVVGGELPPVKLASAGWSPDNDRRPAGRLCCGQARVGGRKRPTAWGRKRPRVSRRYAAGGGPAPLPPVAAEERPRGAGGLARGCSPPSPRGHARHPARPGPARSAAGRRSARPGGSAGLPALGGGRRWPPRRRPSAWHVLVPLPRGGWAGVPSQEGIGPPDSARPPWGGPGGQFPPSVKTGGGDPLRGSFPPGLGYPNCHARVPGLRPERLRDKWPPFPGSTLRWS